MAETEMKSVKTAKKMDNKGMTILEVLVGFLILTIVMTGVYHMIRFGSNMLYQSMDMRKGQEDFEEALYKKNFGAPLYESGNETLGAGAYVLEPTGRFKDDQEDIDLFTGNEDGTKLYSYSYDGEYSQSFGITVHGFE